MTLPRRWTLDTDPSLDLILERIVDLPAPLIWTAWTEPHHLSQWYTPAPWKVVDCELSVRPGGIFRTVVRSPHGEEYCNEGCYLEVVPGERLVWTTALRAGYRPSDNPFVTTVVSLQPKGERTRYTAVALHKDVAARQRHEDIGFHAGWGKALEQHVAHMRTVRVDAAVALPSY